MWTVFTKEKSEQNGPDFSRVGPDRKTKSRNVEFSIVSGPSSTAGGGFEGLRVQKNAIERRFERCQNYWYQIGTKIYTRKLPPNNMF